MRSGKVAQQAPVFHLDKRAVTCTTPPALPRAWTWRCAWVAHTLVPASPTAIAKSFSVVTRRIAIAARVVMSVCRCGTGVNSALCHGIALLARCLCVAGVHVAVQALQPLHSCMCAGGLLVRAPGRAEGHTLHWRIFYLFPNIANLQIEIGSQRVSAVCLSPLPRYTGASVERGARTHSRLAH